MPSSDPGRASAARADGVNLAEGCCSAVSPCFHQRRDPATLCDACLRISIDAARKDDTGKDPWDLAPWDAFRAIVGVLAFGAQKYAPRNWERGMAWSRLYAAILRHLTAWWEGQNDDPETGRSHLAHAGCCVCFLLAYEMRGAGRDDRPGVAQ